MALRPHKNHPLRNRRRGHADFTHRVRRDEFVLRPSFHHINFAVFAGEVKLPVRNRRGGESIASISVAEGEFSEKPSDRFYLVVNSSTFISFTSASDNSDTPVSRAAAADFS
jgi:hypothetical protein